MSFPVGRYEVDVARHISPIGQGPRQWYCMKTRCKQEGIWKQADPVDIHHHGNCVVGDSPPPSAKTQPQSAQLWGQIRRTTRNILISTRSVGFRFPSNEAQRNISFLFQDKRYAIGTCSPKVVSDPPAVIPQQ